MSKDTNDSGVLNERNKDGPDYFGYFRCQIAKLLSWEDEFEILRTNVGAEHGSSKVSNSLFDNGFETSMSDFKQERLRAVLRQSVTVLSGEVDKMSGPCMKTRDLQLQRRNIMNSSRSKMGQARKKQKLVHSPSPIDLDNELDQADPTTDVAPKNPDSLHDIETTVQEQPKENDEVQALLENDNSELDKIMSRFSDELTSKLEYMEKQLEELLDDVVSKCRQMTLGERKQLQIKIKGLPRKNLDRIAELVERNKPLKERPTDEISVNLEKESNVILWRMHYYVEAVEKAKELCRLR